MEQIGLVAYEKILVANIANGERFETYAIQAPKGSHTISLNGAAAHKGELGDLLVIMSFAQFNPEEAQTWKPRVFWASLDWPSAPKGAGSPWSGVTESKGRVDDEGEARNDDTGFPQPFRA